MERLTWVDKAKGIGILLVVLGHSIGYVATESTFWNLLLQVIGSFHMPLFFFLSAYLQGKSEKQKDNPYTKEVIIRKCISLGIPYFLFSILFWFSKFIMSSRVNNPVTLSELLSCPIFPLSTLWFIYALLLYWLSRVVICKLRISNRLIIVFCFAVSLLAHNINFGDTFSLTVVPRLLKNSFYYATGIELGSNFHLFVQRPCVFKNRSLGVAIIGLGGGLIYYRKCNYSPM